MLRLMRLKEKVAEERRNSRSKPQLLAQSCMHADMHTHKCEHMHTSTHV